MPFQSTNPTTGEVLATYPSLDAAGIERVLATAHDAYGQWRATSFADRALLMTRAAELIESEVPVIAEMMTSEMGKTFAAAKGEVAKCAMTMRYYAEHAEAMLAPEVVKSSGSAAGIRFDPIGAVLAIMPWNFPLWQAVRFAAPTLMAGNVGILKHAPNVPACAEFLGTLFRRAGFPEGVFQNAFIEVEDIEGVLADRRIAAVPRSKVPGSSTPRPSWSTFLRRAAPAARSSSDPSRWCAWWPISMRPSPWPTRRLGDSVGQSGRATSAKSMPLSPELKPVWFLPTQLWLRPRNCLLAV